MRDHPPDPETQNSPEDRHPGRVEQNIFEALKNFEHTKTIDLVHRKLQRRFGFSPATACTIAELAFVAACPR